ncbi:MAG TPA: iron-containing alcohol dehydrogenase [Clostridia bacterium]|nr:iron-containing alcohol dehydrogenase [Clostridia bacterium]
MNKDFNLKMPGAVFGGENALNNIKNILAQNQVKRLAIFTDKGVEGAGLLELPMAVVRSTGVETMVLNDLPAEPTYAQAQKLVDQCKASGADFIMAVGGGSVMDTAKLASVLVTDAYGIYELLDDPKRAKKCLKTLMIPTTAGTGAEATPNAIVAVPEKQLKVGIVNDHMIADYVILEAEMIKCLPRKIAASTGVDALAHAIECYTGNKANPFSDIFAMRAMEMIFANLEQACDDPEALGAKRQMLTASFYAGVAITASGTTAVHALSYPLGGKYHIPHGVSNAILLAPVMRFNEPACRRRLTEVYDRCLKGGAASEKEKSIAVIERLEGIVRHLDIPTSLQAFGVPAEDLEALVISGMAVTRLLTNNMQPVTPEDARSIYQQVM